MKPDAKDLFARAHELSGEAREAFLAEACGDDAELHLEVQRLLVQAARADSFFGDGGGATLGAEAFNDNYCEKEGDEVGPYKLRQQIGEGGFGSVWMAEQSVPISRMVALKVIKAGMDTKQVLSRFEAERQALAMMDHPHIAKVLDAGATPAGRPWFAMELVKGIPITEYCDQAGLGTNDRLALFRDVCAAINHAHQKGIIHRDVKPSNVMVTLHGDKPVVKVIDFGIAKATQGKLTDQTLFTRFEQFIGTPVYMSPEQASLSGLDIDTRSDIYALGILLYELLVGKPPFDSKSLVSAGYEEMRRIIREVEPVKPSSRLSTIIGAERTTLAKNHKIDEAKLNRLVEPDLDWIVMKAIEKDRTRRYETANAFAQDIGRFLADEPVTARPPSASYQFRKFARRHKGVFRVAALIALLLVAATVVSSWQAVRATRAETRTQAALEDAEATSKFLTDMFTQSQPGAEKGGREVKVVDVLDPAVAALEANGGIPPARRAILQATLGKTYHTLGLNPQAIALQEKVRDFYLKTLGPEHSDTLAALSHLSIMYGDAGRKDEALKLRQEVLALLRKVSGPEHPATLKAMHNLAASYYHAGRLDEAIALQEEVLPLSRKVNGPEHPDVLLVMNGLAISYSDAGRPDEALKMLEEVLALRRKLSGPEHPETVNAMHNLASSYDDVGRGDEALKLQEEVLPLSRKVNGPEHPMTLMALHNLAAYLGGAGRRDEALEMREEVVALSRKVLGPEHPTTLMAMNNLAVSYSDVDRPDEALKMLEEVLALSPKVHGPEHPETLATMTNLAICYSVVGRWDEAIKIQEEVSALRRKVSGLVHPETLKAMAVLQMMRMGSNDPTR